MRCKSINHYLKFVRIAEKQMSKKKPDHNNDDLAHKYSVRRLFLFHHLFEFLAIKILHKPISF
jgi:hypothetical protein